MNEADFQKLVWQKGRELYRDMPWRANTDPYYVLVSEMMLQQTQVDRVIPKFNEFIKRFPDVKSLASTPLADVLTIWNGLGYNRRAQFLHQAAKKVVADFNGVIPESTKDLISLPGVGANTGGAIVVYGFNQPALFIETNIRTVYFHHFFQGQANVHDRDLEKIVAKTLDYDHPRDWYQALMDYGSYLKKQGSGLLAKSAHYKKQSSLEGSVRQMRGAIIRALTAGSMTEETLRLAAHGDERFGLALNGLLKDGLISSTSDLLHLTK